MFKKIIEEYLHFYVIKMIFGFLNRRKTCLYQSLYHNVGSTFGRFFTVGQMNSNPTGPIQ